MKTTDTNTLSDFELIDRIIQGDASATRALILRHEQYAFTIAYRIVGNREDAEEAAQDGFVRALRALPSFQKGAKFTTWFYKIVVNAAINIHQKRNHTAGAISLDTLTNVSDNNELKISASLKNREQKAFIQQALQQLSPDDRVVLTLFYLKEQSIEEIATTTDITENLVKVKLHRSRKRLASVMEEMMQGEEKSLF